MPGIICNELSSLWKFEIPWVLDKFFAKELLFNNVKKTNMKMKKIGCKLDVTHLEFRKPQKMPQKQKKSQK